MIETKGVVHFSLPVRDIGRAVAFYRDVLGMTVSEQREKMAFLRTGNDHFMLCQTDGAIDPNPGGGVMNHHAFWVDGDRYDDYVADLKRNNVEILYEEDRPPPANFSGRRAYFHDPDGNALEIIDWTNPTK